MAAGTATPHPAAWGASPGLRVMAKNGQPALPEATIGGRLGAAQMTALMWLLSPLLLVVTVVVLSLGFVGVAIIGLRDALAGRGE